MAGCEVSASLRRLAAEAIARFNALSPEEQRAERRAMAISWAYGNAALSNPDVTRETVEEAYDRLHAAPTKDEP